MTRDSQYPKGVTQNVRVHSCFSVDSNFLELSEWTGVILMHNRTRIYVACVAIAAAAGAAITYRAAPGFRTGMLSDALLLCTLALTAEFFSYVLPKAATGSIAFIPYFAAAIVAPNWTSVLGVVIVKAAVEAFRRKPFIKALLNVSAYAVMQVAAITMYIGFGGVALRELDHSTLAQVTRQTGFQALAAAALAMLTQNLLVLGAIALDSGRSMRTLLRENQGRTAGVDFIAVPLIFIFAWAYTAYGPLAAAALWAPILGLRQVHRTNLELEQTNEELLELMVKSLEARDPYTSGHSRRVQQYSTVIARAVGLGEREIEHISRAALLHDVGKIYDKYAGVLSKQDKLTPEEWAIIQDHPADGANLVSTMTRLRDIVPAIKHHHENWNGTGYPDGLAGEMIPIASRIIRFADTIDAMTTERPYRAPLTEAQVRAEVIRCRSSQFDPQITDQLLSSPLWTSIFASPNVDPSRSRPAVSLLRKTPLAVAVTRAKGA
jgi:putative nucleotidyltransferase with HDIG domain